MRNGAHHQHYLSTLRISWRICDLHLSIWRRESAQSASACHTEKFFPGLQDLDPKLYETLRELQAYRPGGCKAMPRLAKLVNENKHTKLSPQSRREERGLTIDFPGGASIKMGPGAAISGYGTISSGGRTISPAGGSISGESPAAAASNVKQTVDVWVSFHFDESGEEVMALLHQCREDVERTVATISRILWRQSS